MGRRGLVVVCCLLAVTVGPPAAHAADAQPPRVVSHLTFDADRSGRLVVSESDSLAAPMSAATAESLWIPAGSSQRWLATDFGLFDPSDLYQPVVTGDLTVGKGRLVGETNGEVFVEPGVEGEAGPFRIGWGDRTVIRTVTPRQEAQVEWVVVLALDQVNVDSLTPPPSGVTHEGSTTTVTWRFAPGEAGSVRASLTPPWAVRAAAHDNSLAAGVGFAVAHLVFLLPFLLVLFLLSRRDDLKDRLEDADVLRYQLRWLLAAAALSVAVGSLILARAELVEPGSWRGLVGDVVLSLPELAALGSAAAIFAAGRRGQGWLIGTLSALAGVVVVATVGHTRAFDWTVFTTVGGNPLYGLDAVLLWLLLFMVVDGLLRVWLYWLEGRRDPARMLGRLWPRADLPALAITALLWMFGAAYTHGSFAVLVETSNTVINLPYNAAALIPLALLPAAVRLLQGRPPSSTFLVDEQGPWLLVVALFLLFVVPSTAVLSDFEVPVPLLIALAAGMVLAASRLVRLDRLQRAVTRENPGAVDGLGVDGQGLLVQRREELLGRAVLLAQLKQERRGSPFASKDEDESSAAVLLEERETQERFGVVEEFLQTGVAPPGTSPSGPDRELVRLRLPSTPRLLHPALGCGPGRDWRENGEIAFRYGLRLSLVPLLYFLFQLLESREYLILPHTYGVESIYLTVLVGAEVAFWLVAVYAFGCLFSWLPGPNGPIKGFALASVVGVGVVAGLLCPVYIAESDWVLQALMLFVVLSVLGFVLDLRTVRDAGLRPRRLAELYEVRSIRFGLVNLVPLVVAVIAIYHEIRSGNPQKALEDALENLPHHVAEIAKEGK